MASQPKPDARLTGQRRGSNFRWLDPDQYALVTKLVQGLLNELPRDGYAPGGLLPVPAKGWQKAMLKACATRLRIRVRRAGPVILPCWIVPLLELLASANPSPAGVSLHALLRAERLALEHRRVPMVQPTRSKRP